MLCFFETSEIPEGGWSVGAPKANQQQNNWGKESLPIIMGFKSSAVEPNFSESQDGRLGRLLPNKHNECTEQESDESIHTFDVSANIINEACSTEQFPTCEICSKYNIIMNLIQEAYNKCTKYTGTFTKEADKARKLWAVVVQSVLDTGERDSCRDVRDFGVVQIICL